MFLFFVDFNSEGPNVSICNPKAQANRKKSQANKNKNIVRLGYT